MPLWGRAYAPDGGVLSITYTEDAQNRISSVTVTNTSSLYTGWVEAQVSLDKVKEYNGEIGPNSTATRTLPPPQRPNQETDDIYCVFGFRSL